MKEELIRFAQAVKPQANSEAMVCTSTYRITVLTERMLRLEYNEAGLFVDQATQKILNREFEVPKYSVIETEDQLEVVTEELHLYYDKRVFSPQGLRVVMTRGFGIYGSSWNYGKKASNLKGTARTLDNVDGEVELEDGILSREGFSVIDDSASAVIDENGWIRPREGKGFDLYFLGYGHDYLGCLKDFYKLCGRTPLLPRYVLGNWWSRFYPYTQDEYLALMDRFREEDVPMAVSVMDMNWHLTDIPAKYGSSWTGYTWDENLFPDHVQFLEELHKRNLFATLNLHPADGVKGHEKNYLPMAKAMGVDYENEERIPFDVTDEKFMDAYFTYMHHPLEDEGVDFWWIDWQQGETTRTPGIDALWMLNHLHYIDHGRNGNRPLTFSRYAGIGSHRYPIGFSGDCVTSWESLDFQPYFTANASNVGYSWWSHDIGGHQLGNRDDELVTRWIQFGVFSPIMRLHSTANPFYGKEPWNYGMHEEKVMKEFLRLRHKLIPYLYSANYATYEDGAPLMKPMYYLHDEPEAYVAKNEYYFGDQMIVCPVTSKMDDKLRLSKTKVWLPKGVFYDFFTNNVYEGNRKIDKYCSLEQMPVFVPAGAIIPLAIDYKDSHVVNPSNMELRIYFGGDGHFDLVEDDCKNISETQGIVRSSFAVKCVENGITFACERHGALSGIVDERNYTLKFIGVASPKQVKLNRNGKECNTLCHKYDAECKILTVFVDDAKDLESFDLCIELEDKTIQNQDIRKQIFKILNDAQISFVTKEDIYRIIMNDESVSHKLSALHALELDENVFGSMLSLLTTR